MLCMQVSPSVSFMQPLQPNRRSNRGPRPLASSSHSDADLEAIKLKVLSQITQHRQGALQQMFGWVSVQMALIIWIPMCDECRSFHLLNRSSFIGA